MVDVASRAFDRHATIFTGVMISQILVLDMPYFYIRLAPVAWTATDVMCCEGRGTSTVVTRSSEARSATAADSKVTTLGCAKRRPSLIIVIEKVGILFRGTVTYGLFGQPKDEAPASCMIVAVGNSLTGEALIAWHDAAFCHAEGT